MQCSGDGCTHSADASTPGHAAAGRASPSCSLIRRPWNLTLCDAHTQHWLGVRMPMWALELAIARVRPLRPALGAIELSGRPMIPAHARNSHLASTRLHAARAARRSTSPDYPHFTGPCFPGLRRKLFFRDWVYVRN